MSGWVSFHFVVHFVEGAKERTEHFSTRTEKTPWFGAGQFLLQVLLLYCRVLKY